jgi:hypothetical protein
MGPVGSRKRAARLGCAAGTAASKVLIILACLRSPMTDPQRVARNYGVVRGVGSNPNFGCAIELNARSWPARGHRDIALAAQF